MIEILTGVLVIVTAIYAWLTYKILRANEAVVAQMKVEHEATRRPYITVSAYVPASSILFYLKICNTGRSAAKNLRLTMDKDFFEFGDQNNRNNIRSHSAFREPITYFAPGAEMTFYLAQSFVIFSKDANQNVTPKVFNIKAEYEHAGRSVIEETTVDLTPYFNSAMVQDPILSQLEKLTKVIEKKKL